MLHVDFFQIQKFIEDSLVPEVNSISVRVFNFLMFSTIICNGQMFEILEVSERIWHEAVKVIFEKMNPNNLTLSVTYNPVPMIRTGVSITPIFIYSPP